MTPEIYERLRKAVETGKWPDGTSLNEEQAKREGLFHAAVQAYRRTNIDFTTDMDGWESNYGDVTTTNKQYALAQYIRYMM